MKTFKFATSLLLALFISWNVWVFRWTSGTRMIESHDILQTATWYTSRGDRCGWVYTSYDGTYSAAIFYRWPVWDRTFFDKEAAYKWVSNVCGK